MNLEQRLTGNLGFVADIFWRNYSYGIHYIFERPYANGRPAVSTPLDQLGEKVHRFEFYTAKSPMQLITARVEFSIPVVTQLADDRLFIIKNMRMQILKGRNSDSEFKFFIQSRYFDEEKAACEMTATISKNKLDLINMRNIGTPSAHVLTYADVFPIAPSVNLAVLAGKGEKIQTEIDALLSFAAGVVASGYVLTK